MVVLVLARMQKNKGDSLVREGKVIAVGPQRPGEIERQIEVLGYVVQGLRNKEIARLLDRSEVVVKKHVTATLQALGAPNRTKLLALLAQRGYRVPSMRASADGE